MTKEVLFICISIMLLLVHPFDAKGASIELEMKLKNNAQATDIDTNGNLSVAKQDVTVVPASTILPTLIAPKDVLLEATDIQTPVTLGDAVATDSMGNSLIVVDNAPSTFPLGVTSVHYSTKDSAGNLVAATQNVTVVDTSLPTITAPPAINTESGNGQSVPVLIGQASAVDVFNPVTISHDAPVNFPVGMTTVTWSATDANGNTSRATQNVTVTTMVLPPDPGAAGKVTLAGIDSDGDGVRDDVQRWIGANYPASAKMRAALTQMAKAKQEFLLTSNDSLASHRASRKSGKSIECLAYISPDTFSKVETEFRSVILNTPIRSKAYLQADRQLSGAFFRSTRYEIMYTTCKFNPGAMHN